MNKSPIDKAKELVEKIEKLIFTGSEMREVGGGHYDSYNVDLQLSHDDAKFIATTLVDEIINMYPETIYWQQVKTEIDLL
jgi:hypothetical protein